MVNGADDVYVERRLESDPALISHEDEKRQETSAENEYEKTRPWRR